MKVGKIIRKFVTKDGKNVIFRTPILEDLDDFLELINSLVDERQTFMSLKKFQEKKKPSGCSKS